MMRGALAPSESASATASRAASSGRQRTTHVGLRHQCLACRRVLAQLGRDALEREPWHAREPLADLEPVVPASPSMKSEWLVALASAAASMGLISNA